MPEGSIANAKTVSFAAPRIASDLKDTENAPEVASDVKVDEYTRYLLGVGKFRPNA
jgi:hypothetical protein